MSRAGQIDLPFGAETRSFRLGVGEWRQVQEKCDAGPAELLARLAQPFQAREMGYTGRQVLAAGLLGRWRIDDVREPLYRGLVGGGMTPTAAAEVIRELVDERPLLESVAIAYQVVLASVIGVEDEPVTGEGEPQGAAASASPAASSPSSNSTGRARRSGSRREK